MQVFQQLFFYKNVNFYSKRTLSNPPFFTKPSSTFSMAFPKVLEGFAARKVLGCVLECGEGGNYKGVWCYTLVAGLYL
jgi:hypothetical protein